MIRIYYSDVINDIYLEWEAGYEDIYEDIRLERIMQQLNSDDNITETNK